MSFRIPLGDRASSRPETGLEHLATASIAALGLWGSEPVTRSPTRQSEHGTGHQRVRRHAFEVADADGRTFAIELDDELSGPYGGMWTARAEAKGLRWPDGTAGGALTLRVQINLSSLDCVADEVPPPVWLELLERLGTAVGTRLELDEVLFQAEWLMLDGLGSLDRWRVPQLARHLRDRGVEPTVAQRTQLLHRALTLGKSDAVEALLEVGADPSLRVPPRDEAALHVAAARHDLSQVERLVAAGAAVNGPDSLARTPLHRAVFSHRDLEATLATIDRLVAMGADLEATTDSGDTPAIVALRSSRGRDDLAVLERLFTLGADPYRRDSEGRDLIALAAEWNRDPNALAELARRIRGPD